MSDWFKKYGSWEVHLTYLTLTWSPPQTRRKKMHHWAWNKSYSPQNKFKGNLWKKIHDSHAKRGFWWLSREFTHFQRYRKFLLSDQRHHLKDSLWNKLFVDRASDFLFLFPQHFFDALVSTFCETQLPISDTRIFVFKLGNCAISAKRGCPKSFKQSKNILFLSSLASALLFEKKKIATENRLPC